jgi:hypothetical protein
MLSLINDTENLPENERTYKSKVPGKNYAASGLLKYNQDETTPYNTSGSNRFETRDGFEVTFNF